MASLGNIHLGGSEGSPDSSIVYNSGAGFDLHSPSKLSKMCFFEDGKWQVEVKEGQSTIIARTQSILTPEETLNQSSEMCHKFLDLISVAKIMNAEMKNSPNSHILLFKEGKKWVLRLVSGLQLISSTKASAIVIRNGKEIPSPPKPKPKPEWIPAFRYYRLSRMSHDLYEAYRNLFLGFEAILSDIVPIKKSERETVWLKRALKEINAQIPLSQCVPINTSDPIDFFFKKQYGLRCDLFHAKGNNCILPFSQLEIKDIADSYEYLHRLWNEIINCCYDVPNNGGSLTYTGFKISIENLLSKGFEILAVDDPRPSKNTDTEANPLGYPEIHFSHLNYESTSLPGRVSIKGDIESEALRNIEHLYSFYISSNRQILMFNHVETGIFPAGIDKLECYFNIQIKNNNLP